MLNAKNDINARPKGELKSINNKPKVHTARCHENLQKIRGSGTAKSLQENRASFYSNSFCNFNNSGGNF